MWRELPSGSERLKVSEQPLAQLRDLHRLAGRHRARFQPVQVQQVAGQRRQALRLYPRLFQERAILTGIAIAVEGQLQVARERLQWSPQLVRGRRIEPSTRGGC